MSPKHIHIVGCLSRSGTTLMTEVMVNCFKIDGYTEHEHNIFREYPYPYKVLCTKNPNDVKRIEYPLKVNNDLHVIYMQRDPRDAISSRSHGNNSENIRRWGTLKNWIENQRHAEKLEQNSRFIIVRYEDLVTNPDQVQKYLQERLTFLKVKAKFSEYHLVATPSEKSAAALGGIRPISPSSIGSWRKNKAYLKAQIEKYGDISETLERLQYESDDKWLEDLKAVTADNTEEPIKTRTRITEWKRKVYTYPKRQLLYRISCSKPLGIYFSKLRFFLRKISP